MNIVESKVELQTSLKVRAYKNTLNKIQNYKTEIAAISDNVKEKESLSMLPLFNYSIKSTNNI